MGLWSQNQLREMITSAKTLGYHEDVKHFEEELAKLEGGDDGDPS